jgi:uncharacterized membrane protein
MSISCPDCTAAMPDTAAFCPGCGRGMQTVERARGNVGSLPRTLTGALAYCTIVPAIALLLIDPYRKDQFVRFHSVQSIGLWLAALLVGVALWIASLMLFFIRSLGPLVSGLAWIAVVLGFFVVWVLLIVKALQGEMFKLPWIGDFAEQQK